MDGDLSVMLRQMMENPQFGSMVEAVKKQMGGGEGKTDAAPLDLSGMMEKLPAMMQLLGPMMAGANGASPQPVEQSTPNDAAESREGAAGATTTAAPPTTGHEAGRLLENQFFRPGGREKRNKLLAALKPYLSPARCSLVDRAMSAMQLGELLGNVMPWEKG